MGGWVGGWLRAPGNADVGGRGVWAAALECSFPTWKKVIRRKRFYVGNTLAGVLKKKGEINDARMADRTGQGSRLPLRRLFAIHTHLSREGVSTGERGGACG